MRSSRDRARREYAPATPPHRAETRADSRADHRIDSRVDSRVDSRSDSRSDGRSGSTSTTRNSAARTDSRLGHDSRLDVRMKRSHPAQFAPQGDYARKRVRSGPFPGASAPAPAAAGAVGSRAATLAPGVLDAVPRLAEWRASRRASARWPWDRHARGYENVSAQALKLLGYATPESTYDSAAVPDEIVRIRNARPLTARQSWLARQVGSTVYASPRDAALAVARRAGARPAGIRALLEREQSAQVAAPHAGVAASEGAGSNVESGSSTSANASANASADTSVDAGEAPAAPRASSADLFTDVDAVVVRGCDSAEAAEARYGARVVHTARLDALGVVAKFETVPASLQDGDSWLFAPDAPAAPVIEVLNALPLAKPAATDILRAMTDMCASIGFAARAVWRSADTLPFGVPRVFIALEDAARTRDAAAALGEKRLQGRPLITAVSHCAPDADLK